MKKSHSTKPTQQEISAAVKTGMSACMSFYETIAKEIPWDVRCHSDYRDVNRETAEKSVIESASRVLFRNSSREGHLAVTTLNNKKEPKHFLLSNQALNERTASCKYYKVNIGDVIVELTQMFVSTAGTGYQDFILRGIDQRIEAVKEELRQQQEKLVEKFIVEDDDENNAFEMK